MFDAQNQIAVGEQTPEAHGLLIPRGQVQAARPKRRLRAARGDDPRESTSEEGRGL